MKRLILLVALVMAMAVLAPAAFADDDPPEVESSDVEMEEKDLSAAQERKAKMIAGYFAGGDPSKDRIINVKELRSGDTFGHKVGWGVLYKLMLYVGAEGIDEMSVEGGWAIGELRKIYLESGGNAADLPKSNLGRTQKAAKDKPEKPDKVMPLQSNKDKQKG